MNSSLVPPNSFLHEHASDGAWNEEYWIKEQIFTPLQQSIDTYGNGSI